jgi:hypothetical protein
MALSSELLSQFAKTTNDNKPKNTESSAYGQIKTIDGVDYVQLDGSELLTPITSTTVVNDGDRVIVTIKNHTAIVTGDLTNPSASNKDVSDMGNKISDFEIVIANKVSAEQLEVEIARIDKIVTDNLEATNAKIETFEGKVAKIDQIEADNVKINNKLTAHEGEFETIRSDIADFKDVTTDSITSIEGNFNDLQSNYAAFEELYSGKITANEANITKLQTEKLSAEEADLKYANIDFSNIDSATMGEFFANSGVIENVVIKDGHVTGTLAGVTIKGDLIEGGTIVADKLVILGDDGLYYKLNTNGETVETEQTEYNSLSGTVITAKTITAEKINVSDLVAFGATIGGFHISDNAIYSGVKESMDNTTEGIHLNKDGEICIGDGQQYVKYYLDANGERHLEVISSSIKFESDSPTIQESINSTTEQMSMLDVKAEGINAAVTEIKTIQNTSSEALENLQSELATLTKSVQTKISAEDLTILIQAQLVQDGVNQVQTATGYTFNEDGLTISKTGSDMTTTVDEDGMNIVRDELEVFNADSDGVSAYNLHAKTYLIVGTTSRFEDYVKNGKKRTGCFWVGGND